MRWTLLLTACLSACDLSGTPDIDPFDLPVSQLDTGANLAPPAQRPRLWYTCGDPVCQGYTGPYPGTPDCQTYVEGDRCPRRAIGRTCDPMDFCNRRLECRRDPNPGPCPISKAEHKRQIAYLDAAATDALAKEVLDVKLATYRYNWDSDETRQHLGFIIDDQPTSAAVAQDGEHVDLYGYTSMTVAALQAQQRQIALLEAKIAALEAKLAE